MKLLDLLQHCVGKICPQLIGFPKNNWDKYFQESYPKMCLKVDQNRRPKSLLHFNET